MAALLGSLAAELVSLRCKYHGREIHEFCNRVATMNGLIRLADEFVRRNEPIPEDIRDKMRTTMTDIRRIAH